MKLFKFTFLLLTALLISQEQTKAGDFVDLQEEEENLQLINNYTITCNSQAVRQDIIGYLLEHIDNPTIANLGWEAPFANTNIVFHFDQPQDYYAALLSAILLIDATNTYGQAHPE